MSSTYQRFKDLHKAEELFLLPNAWDARSAMLFEQSGFPAIGTSSAAVANSLGVEDGQHMSFEDYLFVIRKIISAITVPLTVDLEMGYGKNDKEIAHNVCSLARLGVIGINIEDSMIHQGSRKLKDAVQFAETIRYIKSTLKSENLEMFINIRCDTYIINLPDALSETIKRLTVYNEINPDSVFVPCIVEEKHIAAVVEHSMAPLNVMCVPGLPVIESLNALGVKRVSMGPFAFQKLYKGIGELSKDIIASGGFELLFS